MEVGYKLLYVGGFGRSGSTLVGRVLGQPAGSICVGETCYLATRGLIEDVQCGCGQPFRSCSFWGAVGEEAFGGWRSVDVEQIAELDELTSRHRTIPFQLSLRGRAELTAAADRYAAWLSRLYPAIAKVSGAEVIVETSKDPWFAGLLARMHDRDLRIVHLVRDSRAVAYSWTRSKQRPSPVGKQSYMPRFRPADTAVKWMMANSAFHALASKATAYRRINYEEFVARPGQALEQLSSFAEGSLRLSSEELNGNSVRLDDHHIFSGNPMRSKTGWLEMRVDDEWEAALPERPFAQVTAITWPLLRLYGYPTRPPGRSQRRASAAVSGPDSAVP
jgi:Sulfotransferase family